MESLPVFNPASPQARAISSLFLDVLLICGAILAIVAALIVYNLVRFRCRRGDGEPRQIFGSRRLEIVWTVVPFLLLVWIFVLTVRAMHISDPSANEPPDLIVTGHQWWWEARYPKAGFATANEIHIPAGRKWLVQLESADVIHDFWVPELARKKDMVPGVTNYIWLEAERPGTYLGACAEYCGAEHAWMRFLVIAEPESKYNLWEAAQARPTLSPETGPQRRGLELFRDRTCINCHSIRGVWTAANAGPDLSHLPSRRTLGAGVLKNTPLNLARWLKDPQSIKPGCRMPDLNLTGKQVDDLVSYLERLP